MVKKSMLHDLYNGEETISWFDDESEFIEVVFCSNGISLTIERDKFSTIVDELTKAAKMLELYTAKKINEG
jgi:hypothetical protein